VYGDVMQTCHEFARNVPGNTSSDRIRPRANDAAVADLAKSFSLLRGTTCSGSSAEENKPARTRLDTGIGGKLFQRLIDLLERCALKIA